MKKIRSVRRSLPLPEGHPEATPACRRRTARAGAP